ncbi:MAG: M23 family metallopeptidase [Clostridia bacterium]|nr:M23 family metallopeptidase [Clostridia bacterium]
MRRDFRKKQDNKILMYSIGAGLVLIAIVFAILMYSSSINKDVRNGQLNSDQIASILNNDDENSESASNNMGKTVEEGEKDLDKEKEADKQNKDDKIESTNTTNEKETSSTTSEYKTETNENNQNTNTTKDNANSVTTSAKATKEEDKKDLVFQKPVEGDIVKEFAKDNLVYSETLKEWVTHLGIDIKAEKTTVVNASEAGTIKSIKNDPRYGLTIVIEHEDNFQTVYANLLSSEFVKVGDKVEKGQPIGTVGNTGTFESVDEPHLHFEILLNSMQVDPSIYLR